MLADFFSTLLELGGVERVCDGHDAVHDGMDSAEIRVLAGSQPRKCKIAVWSDDSRIEGAGVSLLQAIDMRDCMIGGCGVVPPDRGSSGDCGRLRDPLSIMMAVCGGVAVVGPAANSPSDNIAMSIRVFMVVPARRRIVP